MAFRLPLDAMERGVLARLEQRVGAARPGIAVPGVADDGAGPLRADARIERLDIGERAARLGLCIRFAGTLRERAAREEVQDAVIAFLRARDAGAEKDDGRGNRGLRKPSDGSQVESLMISTTC